MQWEFNLPVKLEFGTGARKNIKQFIDEIGGKNGVLVCSKSFAKTALLRNLLSSAAAR